MSRRERHNLLAKADKVLCLACKKDFAAFVKAVEQRPDSYGIACGNILMGFSVIDYQCKFRVKLCKHFGAVFFIERQKQLAVGIADKGIALFLKLLFKLPETVKLAVANNKVSVFFKGLHSAFLNTHDCKAVKAEEALARVYDTGHIGTSGLCFFKALFKFFKWQFFAAISHY